MFGNSVGKLPHYFCLVLKVNSAHDNASTFQTFDVHLKCVFSSRYKDQSAMTCRIIKWCLSFQSYTDNKNTLCCQIQSNGMSVSDVYSLLGFKQLRETISVNLSSNTILSDFIRRRLMSAANTAQ